MDPVMGIKWDLVVSAEWRKVMQVLSGSVVDAKKYIFFILAAYLRIKKIRNKIDY